MPAERGVVVDPEFVRTLATTLVKGLAAWEQRQVALKVIALGGDKDLAREVAAEAGPPPGCAEVIALSAAEIAQKYDWIGQWTAELALGVALSMWAGNHFTLMARLNRLAEEKTKVEAK